MSAGAHGVMKLEGPALTVHLVHHGDKGCDADTTGHHDVFPAAMIVGKEIYGLTECEGIAFTQLLMQEG